jgi:septum formation protein
MPAGRGTGQAVHGGMEQAGVKDTQQEAYTVVLASSSPQRRQILGELGIAFRFVDPQITEVTLPDAAETVTANAKLKVLGAVPSCRKEEVILGADTVLCVKGKVRGKPASPNVAVAQLMELSGGEAIAWTGVATFSAGTGRGVLLVETARVSFNVFAREAAEWYVGTGEPLTRAGALGVSLLGEAFVNEIRGAHSCVVGLPKRATLLACSDAHALGNSRIDLPDVVRAMLKWSWIQEPRYFAEDGQWV